MLLKKSFAQRVLAVMMTVILVGNSVTVPAIWAEEVSDTTPTPTAATETVLEPTVVPSETSTVTGDASSTATTDTTANSNTDTIPGELDVPADGCSAPEGQTTCSGDIAVSNVNDADITTDTEATSSSGNNEIIGSGGDATIDTGDAASLGVETSQINTNTTQLESPGPSSSEGADQNVSETSPTPTGAPKNLDVSNTNDGDVANNVVVDSSTGNNIASENLGDATIESGDALAIANLLNLLNINITASDFEVLCMNLLGDKAKEIDLNALWEEIQNKNGAGFSQVSDENDLSLAVENNNDGNLENNVQVTASTGNNEEAQNGGDAKTNTGDAAAVANVTNVVNTNIVGSKFLLGVINIIDPGTGNIILPRPEKFEAQPASYVSGDLSGVENTNIASLDNNLQSLADSGSNGMGNNGKDESIRTGDASSLSNSISLVNMNVWDSSWFFLILNNLGGWTGRVLGWNGQEGNPEPGTSTFAAGGDSQSENIPEDASQSPFAFQNFNNANVKNNIQTTASTGNNQIIGNTGSASLETGDARSAANLLNLVNLNLIGGRWFLGIINIVGGWGGDLVFAYPDVAVNVSATKNEAKPGEEIQYVVDYKNIGYDLAENVDINIQLPAGLIYLTDDSGFSPSISGQKVSWLLGPLAKDQAGQFVITARVRDDFDFNILQSWFSKLMPKVHADETEKSKDIVVTATISTSIPESNSNNNSASATTIVYEPDENKNEVDTRQPILEISARNNVGEYVYPGDTVTFEVTVKNVGPGPAYNARLVQNLFNGGPEDFGTIVFDLGTIEPGKGGKLTFGLKLLEGNQLPEDDYRTIAQVEARAADGTNVYSNEARTYFDVKYRALGAVLEAQAAEEPEKVLGVVSCPNCPKDRNVLPYVLLFLLSSVYITSWTKSHLAISENEEKF